MGPGKCLYRGMRGSFTLHVNSRCKMLLTPSETVKDVVQGKISVLRLKQFEEFLQTTSKSSITPFWKSLFKEMMDTISFKY